MDLLAHKRLLVRLRNDHEKYQFISGKVYQLSAGYAGEVEVDQIFPEIGLPTEHTIFKDIRLEVLPNFYIQLDTLIITRNSIILLEIKNYSGTIYFDEQVGKTIRTASNGDVDKFDCAVHQVDRAVHGLREILHNFPMLPIHPIIVMANRRTEIAQYPETTPVKYKKQLPKYIRQLLTQQETIAEHTLDQVIKQIHEHLVHRQHTPLCERYAIPVTDLQQGVLCLAYNQQMTKSQGRSWTCEVCQLTNPKAVEQSVTDWFYLIQPTLSNKQLRQFLKINPKSATHALSELKLPKKGKGKRTYYVQRKKNPMT